MITRRQLLEAGLSSDAIKRRLEKAVLHRVHRGVFRLGHLAPSVAASYLAAVLACGRGAVLSGYAAAFHLGLRRGAAPLPEVSATAEHDLEGVITHRVRGLDRRDVSEHRGIPVTTVPRTIVDLAGDHELDPLAALCHQAQVRYLVKAVQLQAALARKPNAKGAARLHRIFRGDAQILLSELERAFVNLLQDAGLPRPQTNRPIGRRYIDCRWPENELTVELDGYTYHHTRHAWEQDRRREREARARGDEFRRYTYDDVSRDAGLVLAELRPLVSRATTASAGAPSAPRRPPGPRVR